MKKIFAAALLFIGCAPLKEFKKIPVYTGKATTQSSERYYDPGRENVFILADNKGTEIFDLVAPFYMFSLTGRANVYIIARDLAPVSVMKGFFALPHYTFKQADSIGLIPSAIVIPNFSATKDDQQDPEIGEWIRKKYSTGVSILSVCAGSFTAAATGLYDGKLMTTHATEMAGNKKLFAKPLWVENLSYTKDGNLYSTAGVSNATEGTLALIKDMFGEGAMRQVMQKINYRFDTLKTSHRGMALAPADKKALLKKVLSRKDKNVGVLMYDGIDEFKLAAILDSYHRTVPAALKTYTTGNKPVTSKFGLVLIPTGRTEGMASISELHVIGGASLGQKEKELTRGLPVVHYDSGSNGYIFDICLERIGKEYGRKFEQAVRRLLDYH